MWHTEMLTIKHKISDITVNKKKSSFFSVFQCCFRKAVFFPIAFTFYSVHYDTWYKISHKLNQVDVTNLLLLTSNSWIWRLDWANVHLLGLYITGEGSIALKCSSAVYTFPNVATIGYRITREKTGRWGNKDLSVDFFLRLRAAL